MNVPLLCIVEFNWKLPECKMYLCTYKSLYSHSGLPGPLPVQESATEYLWAEGLQCQIPQESFGFASRCGHGSVSWPVRANTADCSALLTWTKARCEQLRRCFLIRLDHRVERACGGSVPKGWPLGQAEKVKPKVESLFWTLSWAVRCLSITAGNNQITVCESNFTDGYAKTYSNRCTFLIHRITIELRDTGHIWNIYLPLF